MSCSQFRAVYCLVNADVFAAELGKHHLDWHGAPDLVGDASGPQHDTLGAEMDAWYEVDDVVQNFADDEVIVMADVLSGVLVLLGCFDSVWSCAVCENQAAPEATFHVLVEQRHLPPIACLL